MMCQSEIFWIFLSFYEIKLKLIFFQDLQYSYAIFSFRKYMPSFFQKSYGWNLQKDNICRIFPSPHVNGVKTFTRLVLGKKKNSRILCKLRYFLENYHFRFFKIWENLT